MKRPNGMSQEEFELNAHLLCSCGSGEYKEALYDGHGLFLTYACDVCRREKLSHFRDDIMETYETDEPIEPED